MHKSCFPTTVALVSLMVTADHGRAYGFIGHGGDAPESARVFLLAAGGAVPARGLVSAAGQRRLADIAPTVRALLGAPADEAPGAGAAMAEIVRGDATAAGGAAGGSIRAVAARR